MTSTATLKASASPLIGQPVKYLNRNWSPTSGAGHWLFGWRVDRQIGFCLVFTDDESLAVTDLGEIAAMLGLGTGELVSHSHLGDGGYSSCGATNFESILEAIPSTAAPVATARVRYGKARKGGWRDAHRDSDGAVINNYTCI